MTHEPPHDGPGVPRMPDIASPSPDRPGAGDVLYGAEEIAAFVFGDAKHRRRVYSRVASGQLPVFRIGASICARKSVLLGWMEAQENFVRR